MFILMEWVGGAFIVLVTVTMVAIPVVLFLVIRTTRGRTRGSVAFRGPSGGAAFTPRVPCPQNGVHPVTESLWPLVPGQATPAPEAPAPHHHEAHHHTAPAAETTHHHEVQHHYPQPVPETHHHVEPVHNAPVETVHHAPPPPMPDIPAPTFADTGMHHGGHAG